MWPTLKKPKSFAWWVERPKRCLIVVNNVHQHSVLNKWDHQCSSCLVMFGKKSVDGCWWLIVNHHCYWSRFKLANHRWVVFPDDSLQATPRNDDTGAWSTFGPMILGTSDFQIWCLPSEQTRTRVQMSYINQAVPHRHNWSISNKTDYGWEWLFSSWQWWAYNGILSYPGL